MSDQSPYDASTGGLSRLADSVKQRRTDEYVRRLEADRDRLAAELHEARTDRRREHELRCRIAGELEHVQAELAALSEQCQDVRAQRNKAQAELAAAQGLLHRTEDEKMQLRAELAQARHALLLANGVADLARKHRDEAERERGQLRARVAELEAALDHYSGGASEALLDSYFAQQET